MTKPFSYEDAVAPAAPASGGFSYEEASGEAAKPKQNKGLASDVLTAVKQGALQLPGVATGILDIAPGALGIDRPASKAADFLGSMTGFQPGKWAKEANAEYSPETQQAKSAVDQAWDDPNKGAADVAAAYLQNPRTIGLAAAQSIPSMLAGGVVGRGLGMAAGINSAAARAAIGEGAVMAGSTMDQIDASVDPQRAAAASLVVGAGGAAVGAAGAKIASRFGNVDIDSAIAGGVTTPTGKTMSLAKRVPAGILQEGLLEEAPQSALETGAQNWAEGKPLTEGMARNVTEGALAGGLMGGGAAALTRQQQAQGLPDPDAGQPPAQPPTPQPPSYDANALQALQQTRLDALASEEAGNPDVPQAPAPDGAAALAAQTERANRARQAMIDLSRATESPDDEILQSIGMAESPMRPSVSMGIDPNAGVISKVAAEAVDGPASMEMAVRQAERDMAALAAEDNPEAGADARPTFNDPLEAQVAGYVAEMGTASPQMVAAKFGVTIPRATELLAQADPAVDDLFPPPQGAANVSNTDAAGALAAGVGGPVGADAAGSGPDAGLLAPATGQRTAGTAGTPAPSVQESVAAPVPGRDSDKALTPKQQKKLEKDILEGVTVGVEFGYGIKQIAKGVKAFPGSMTTEQREDAVRRITQRMGLKVPESRGRKEQMEDPDAQGGWTATPTTPQKPTNLREVIALKKTEKANVQDQPQVATPAAAPAPAEAVQAPQAVGGDGAAQSAAAPAGRAGVEADGVGTGGFDSAAWDKARDDTIKASKAAGNKHLDEVPAYVESMRGKKVYYAHDNKVRGVIRTVDNRGNVYIDWSDAYSAEKEMASPTQDGKKTVMRSSIGPTDLKDYVVGEPKKSPSPTTTEPTNGTQAAQAVETTPQGREETALLSDSVDAEPDWWRAKTPAERVWTLRASGVKGTAMTPWKRLPAEDRKKLNRQWGKKADAPAPAAETATPGAALQSAMKTEGWTAEVDSPGNTIWVKRVGGEEYTARMTGASSMEVTVLVNGVGTQIGSTSTTDPKAAAKAASKTVADDVAESATPAPLQQAQAPAAEQQTVNAEGMSRADVLQALEDGKKVVRFGETTWIEKTMAGKVETYVVKSREADGAATFTKGPVGPDRQWGWGRSDAAREAIKSWDFPAAATPTPEPSPLVKAMNDLADVRAKIAAQGQVVDDRLLQRERQLKAMVKELEADGQNDELDAEMRSYENKAAPLDMKGRNKGDMLTMGNGTQYRVVGVDEAAGRIRLVRNPDMLSEREVSLGQEEYDRLVADHDQTRAEAMAQSPAPAPAPQPAAKDDALAEREKAAKAKMLNAAAKLANLLSKNTRANITPEQEQAMLPIAIELFEGAMELGYVKFKQAARYVRDFIAQAIDQDAADSIPIDTLQGAYIATSRRHKDKDITPKAEVVAIESVTELEETAESADTAPEATPDDSTTAGNSPALDSPMGSGLQPPGSTSPIRGARKPRARTGRGDDADLFGSGGRADAAPDEKADLGDGSGPAGVQPGQDGALAVGGGRLSTANYRPKPGGLTREGSWLDTARRNIDLIDLAIAIDKEGRQATPEEQARLSKYVGFGAGEIRNKLFPVPPPYAKQQDPNRLIWSNYVAEPSWKALAERMEALPREWQKSVLQSSQYAHYTSEGIIRSVWSGIQRMGFTGGNVFEPGTGIGSFAMLMPDSVAATSKYTGVEFDGPTALIARLLSPDENMLHGDFIKRKFPKNFFDVNVGNPPFSQTKVLGDPAYEKFGFMLHDFFFAKGIDSVRPGGLQVFVTSKGTMDKQNDKARKYLSERADLLGAIRLPSTAFEGNAGTSVVTDVIFLRKRLPGEAPGGQPWGNLATVQTKDGPVLVNEYYAANPDMVLGEQRISGNIDDMGRRINSNGMGGAKYTVVSYDTTPAELDARFAKAIASLPENAYSALSQSAESLKRETAKVDFDPTIKHDGAVYLAKDGTIMRVFQGAGRPLENDVKLSPKDKEWFTSYVQLRDLVQQARQAQNADGDWEAALKKLNKAYDKFRATHGPITDFRVQVRKSTDEDGNVVETETRVFKNKRLYREDYDQAVLTSIEQINEAGEIVKAPFLQGRTIGKPVTREIKSIGDALAVSLDNTGLFDIDDVARRMKMTREEAVSALDNQVYQDLSGKWLLADEYLSGNVVDKLEEAEEAARLNPAFERNVEALRKVQPEKLGPSQISAKLGASWIPASHVNEFAEEIGAGKVTFDSKTETWQVDGANLRSGRMAGAEYGTAKRSPSELLEAALNSRSVKITMTVDKKTVTDEEGTTAANETLKKIKDKFKGWVWTDTDRAAELVESYNKRFNNLAPRVFDGSHLTLPGVSLRFKLHPHQLRAILRQVQTGDTYLAHAVGAGKTIEMIAGGMEQKRLGLIKKPMYVVPNHMLEQFSNEFMELYPLANIMVADDENFSAERRKAFIAAATLNAPDAIVITHDAFQRIGVKEESVAPIRDEILSDLEIELSATATGNDTRVRRSQLEQQIEAVGQRFDRIIASGGKDATIKFEDMGVDFVYVDEAHAFRKLDFHTAQQIKGIDPIGSKRALDMYVKTRILQSQRPGRAMVFATGTPVTNTMGELYTILRFFAPKMLDEAGISSFDAWARQFAEVTPALEQNAAGKYELVERFAKFDNVPELMSRVRAFMDVLTSEHLGSLVKRPDLIGGKPNLNVIEGTPALKAYMEGELAQRIEISKKWKPSPDQKGNPDPIVSIITDGRFAALDPRFFGQQLKPGEKSILTEMAAKVVAGYKEYANTVYLDKSGQPEKIKGGTQIVFYNLGFGEAAKRNRGFDSRAAFTKSLTDGGIPRAEIAWFDDADTDAKKEAIFKDMRSGKLKVLIGSAKKMGTGVNVQVRLRALHYQDPPWFPSDVEQPHGRIIRQGNQNPKVAIEWYTTKGTYQSTMWQMVGRKQRFIDQAFMGDKNMRSMDDLGEASLFEQAAAVASGDPRALQLAGLKQDVERLERLQAAHASEQINVRNALRSAQWAIESASKQVKGLERAFKSIGEKYFSFTSGTVGSATFTKPGEFGQAIKEAFNRNVANAIMSPTQGDAIKLGDMGQGIEVTMEQMFDTKNKPSGEFALSVEFGGVRTPIMYAVGLGADVDAVGLSTKLRNAVNAVEGDLRRQREILKTNETDSVRLGKKLGAPFEYQQEMLEKYGELKELEEALRLEGLAPKAQPAVGVPLVTEQTPDESVNLKQTGDPAANTADVVFSQGLLSPASVGPKPTPEQIQRLVDKMQQVAKNTLPVTVTASPSDIPGLKVPAGAKPTGALIGGRIYLFADNLKSTGDAYVTLFHELFHLGLQKVIPAEDYAAMLAKFSKNLLVQRFVREWKASPEGVEKAGTMPAAAYDALAAEEALAMVSEELAANNGIGTRNMPGLAKSMLSWLSSVADRLGFPPSFSDWMRGLTRTDAEKFVSDMVRAAMGGEKNLGRTRTKYGTELAQMTEQTRLSAGAGVVAPATSRGDNGRMTEEQAREQGFTLKAYRGVSKANPFNDTGTTWLTTSREVAEAYAEEVMGYDDPGVLEVMVKPDTLPRFDASRLTDEQRAELAADDFGNPQAVGIYDRSDDHPLGGSRRNVTVIHAPREAVVVLGGNQADGVKFRSTPRELAEQSRLSAGAAAQTDTPAFKRWFGDSKVVDADGKPLVVYHGTGADITEFSLDAATKERAAMVTGVPGFYFATAPETAGDYAFGKAGANVMPSYLALRNPKEVVYAELIGGTFDRASLEAQGYDGLTVKRGGKTWSYVAFRPEQIKSAIGNNGQFDAGNPDIRFRSTPRELAGMAADQLKMTLTAPGKLSWWHKTVGTMYNMAERHPAFKPVFNAAQSFIDDVSYYATDAADMAPKMLPKLENWRDIAKSPISAEDNKAIEAPVNEGTLLWARDESGRPVKVAELEAQAADMTADQKARRLLRNDKISEGVLRMWQGLPQEQYEKLIESRYQSQMLAPGLVWTDAELKAIWKLNDSQIGLYREVRAAIDKSLDNLAKSDLVRFVGKDGAGIKDAIMEAGSVDEAALMARDYFIGLAEAEPDRAEMLLATANGIMDRADKVTRLKQQGYAPLSRFGKYTVDVVTDEGRQYFGLFESMREANQMAVRMKGEFGKDAVSQGTLSDESFKLFQGITPETLELFGNMLGLSDTGDTPQDQAFQAYLKLTKNNRSAMKRLIQRKGILGYSQDVGRVLANFIYSNARQTAGALHIGDLTEAVNAIPQSQGELKDEAVRLAEYIQNPQEEAQAFRGLLFAQYLGGSIASAMVNMTQPLQVSLPYLSQFGGAGAAGKELMRAIKGIATGKKDYEPDLARALKHAEEDGTVSPQEVHQLMAQARGAGTLRSGDGTKLGDALAKGGNAWAKMSLAWGKVFGVAEQMNRRSTFIAAYRLAKAQKMADPAGFAKKAVHETQFIYSKANKMRWGRGAIGGVAMTFKTYGIAYLELLHRMATQGGPEGKRAAMLAVAVLLVMGGAGGLPFMEDGEDIADTIAQIMGYNFSSKQAKQELLEELFGEAAAQFIDRGISGVAGVPIDVSGRFGMGNLVPGTGAFLQRNSNARDVLEVLGPAGDLIQRGKDSFMALAKGNVYEAGLNMSPVAIRNLAKGADMAATDMYRDNKGFKVIETTGTEAGLKAIGFQPNTVAKVQEANYLMQRQKDFYNVTAQNIRAKWARGLFEQDEGMVAEAREAIDAWNEKNPDQRMSPNMPAIWRRVREMSKDKDQRIADTAPKAMRAQFREETARVREAL